MSTALHIREASKNDIATIKEIATITWPIAYGTYISSAQLDYMLDMMYSDASLIEQISYIYGDVKTTSALNYGKAALPYWIISLIGMVILYAIFSSEKQFYSLFFAFIAAVTFPHAFVMLKMFSKKNSLPNVICFLQKAKSYH